MELIRIENIIRMSTVIITNIHHIVGVPAFVLWSLANSIAFPISHSSRICFPILSLTSNSIPYGMMIKVITKDVIREARIKNRLDKIRKIKN